MRWQVSHSTSQCTRDSNGAYPPESWEHKRGQGRHTASTPPMSEALPMGALALLTHNLVRVTSYRPGRHLRDLKKKSLL